MVLRRVGTTTAVVMTVGFSFKHVIFYINNKMPCIVVVKTPSTLYSPGDGHIYWQIKYSAIHGPLHGPVHGSVHGPVHDPKLSP